jgi:hypothetical protein
MSFRAGTAATLAGLVLLAAGCGGGAKTPSVAAIESTTSTAGRPVPAAGATTSTTPSFVAFADCMTSHGVPTTTGANGRGIMITGGDPGSAGFQAAQAACRKLLPGGGPPQLTPAQQAKRAQELAVFSRCMRTHGVPGFPDPNGQGQLNLDALNGIDPSSPLVQTAYEACRSLFPKLGPQLRL